ncbi:hypothetical protein H2200_010659 [Cladophialophora chaetospira]|uniref:Cas1p 10 TM acyl transferase domain-containing protein n=1 Tax=Cladophialophora chaetospira TaxID=386627 RepID=A0AA38X0H8_9EURO|nr:hypothetical protein H2200_010659 [Cladophialophora chaetospira]
MITLRTPLLLLLSFSISVALWYILEGIQQESWIFSRCAILSRGWSPTPTESRNAPGCMLRTYNASDIRACLSHQRMTIYGDVEAHQIFRIIAEGLGQLHLINASVLRRPFYLNATILKSDLAQVAYQPDPAWNSTARLDQSELYTPFYVESTDREGPLSNEPSMFMSSVFAFTERDFRASPAEAQIVLNYFCNGLIDPARRQTQAYCCAGYAALNALQKLLLFAASCSIIFCMCAYLLRGKYFHSLEDNSQSAAEARRAINAIATISAVVIACFVSDRTALLDKEAKVVDLTAFIWLAVIALLAGLATVARSQPTTTPVLESKNSTPERHHILSRQQTEEWKGWMQIVILLYHYFGLSKVLWVYQFVRLLVSSYLFMTGFGHTTYFITTNDFSFRRAASVLLRNNLLNVILAFVMGTHYDLYYFPVLTSVWFLIIWVTIPRTPEAGVSVRHCLSKIALSAMTVRLVIEAGPIIESSLDRLDGLQWGLPRIDGREFMFRFSLDLYIVYVGMTTATFAAQLKAGKELPYYSLSWMPSSWSRPGPTLAVLVAIVLMPGYAVFCRLFANKFQHNKWHPFVSPLPLMAFLVLRNSTRQLSSYHSRLFAWFGRCSLETFVLQYHIWLAADSRGVLCLGLFDNFNGSTHARYMLEILETGLIFAAFVAISSAASKALSLLTRSLVAMQAGTLLIFAALWAINLAWLYSVLGRHVYYY